MRLIYAFKNAMRINRTATYLLPCIVLTLAMSQIGYAENWGDGLFKRDSLRVKRPSTANDTWYHGSIPEVRFVIDSSIVNFEEFNPIYNNGPEHVNNGNFGGAAFPLVYQANRNLNFNAGYNQFDLYRFSKDSIRYYQVIRPYTELQMVIGMRNEQYFQGRFANQHKNVIFYGLEFRRMYSKGTYVNQRTNDNGFYLYGIYKSRNKAWSLHADIVFNSFKVQENGGVTDSVFEKNYLQKTLVPVLFREAENNYRQTDFYLKGTRHIGKKIRERINDSTEVNAVVSQFSISYQFNIEKNVFKYRDYDPSSSFYGPFFLADSVFNDLDYLKIGNSVQLDYHMRRITSDSTFENKNFIAQAEAGFDYYLLTHNLIRKNFGNMYLSGGIRNNYSSGSPFIYKATVKYFAYGYNQHDFQADAFAGYDFRKWGTITANFLYQRNETPYIFENYTSHPAEWSFDLPKMQTIAAGFKYQNPTWGVVADVNYYNINKMPVYAGIDNVYGNWAFNSQNVIVMHAGNRNSIKGFHCDNDVWYSSASAGYVRETFPTLYTKHSVYYEARAFKKALWIATGVDLRFRFNNNAPFYDPLLARFYPAFDTDSYTLRLDFFLNFKIRTVRIFTKVENILGAFSPLGHYSLYNAPAADIAFKGGLSWRFFE